jgi:hypothetical protein
VQTPFIQAFSYPGAPLAFRNNPLLPVKVRWRYAGGQRAARWLGRHIRLILARHKKGNSDCRSEFLFCNFKNRNQRIFYRPVGRSATLPEVEIEGRGFQLAPGARREHLTMKRIAPAEKTHASGFGG